MSTYQYICVLVFENQALRIQVCSVRFKLPTFNGVSVLFTSVLQVMEYSEQLYTLIKT